MNKKTFDIWGRSLELEIVFDCYEGEEVLESQNNALTLFCDHCTNLFDVAYKEAVQYCFKNNETDIDEKEITNIFKYVKPKAIYVKRESVDERTVAILCAYKFNPDDGMAIVFKNESFYEIGTENIIL